MRRTQDDIKISRGKWKGYTPRQVAALDLQYLASQRGTKKRICSLKLAKRAFEWCNYLEKEHQLRVKKLNKRDIINANRRA